MLTALGALAPLAFGSPPEVPADLGAPLREIAGCALFKGATEADGVAPMIARCTWPEVDPARLVDMFGRFDAYESYVFGVRASDVRRAEDGRSLVFQEQEVAGLARRQVLLWMRHVEGADGGHRFEWVTAAEEPLEVPADMVRPPRNDGYWQIRPAPGGGAEVEHVVAYDPGGSVPSWVVRRFQTGGLGRVMSEVHAIATKGPAAP